MSLERAMAAEAMFFEGCDCLNDDGLHRLVYLEAWPPVGRTIWEELGGEALLKEMCHCGWDSRF